MIQEEWKRDLSFLNSKEQIYHFVVHKCIVEQKGIRSTKTPYNYCRLRGDDGLRCAIGWLIPDELYDETLESWTAIAVFSKEDTKKIFKKVQDKREKLIEMWGNHYYFLQELQEAHDSGRTPERMKKNFLELGKRFNFLIPDCLLD